MAITNAQTTLTYGNLKTLLQNDDPTFLKPATNFDIPIARAIPQYAKQYTGNFYRVGSQVSSPRAFSTPYKTTPTGNFYEEVMPTDCMDNGLENLQIFSAGGVVPSANVQKNNNIGSWDETSSIICPFRQYQNKLQCFVPQAIVTSGSLMYTESYVREPAIPVADGDVLDVPAEDFDSFYAFMKGEMQTP